MSSLETPGLTALIPARGGSRRLSRKNILLFGEHPLIAHSILAAQSSDYVKKVYVLTDDPEIAEISQAYHANVPYLRDYETSSDLASSESVINEFINQVQPSGDFILLQPTSPLRTSLDIDQAYQKYYNSDDLAVVSVTKYKQGDTNIVYVDPKTQYVSREEKSTANAKLNGAIYISSFTAWQQNYSFWSNKTIAFFMDRDRSVDIDTLSDFQQALKLHNDSF